MPEKDKQQRGTTPEPAETGRDNQQHEHKAKEGDYRNAETRASSQESAEKSRESEVGSEDQGTENRQ